VKSVTIASDLELACAGAAFVGYAPPQIAYGLVRDYCQAADLLPRLASYNQDLKDPQRCWMLKTILATVAPGSTLLEIGAGEPVIADMLGRLGYTVYVVDPYEGAGNGPLEVEAFRRDYPNVRYVVDWFTADLEQIAAASIDCCYSISVIEHIPLDQIPSVVQAMRRFSRPSGRSIHALDHVLAGAGDAYHRQMLHVFCGSLGLSAVELDATLARAKTDPETYFLSAEAHNRWRGGMPYEAMPMRRCISVQFASEV
jgi:hypothetical protein